MAAQNTRKTAVLLVNLGSPSSPSTGDVRRFLREFLGDPRVVNLPRWLWWLILNLFILPFRPRKSAHAYRSIWTAEGSPLSVYTRQLAAKLSERHGTGSLLIDYAMRYGKPGLRKKLHDLNDQQVQNLVILPLYPQYSSTTTASIYDVVSKELLNWRRIPSVHFISDYYQHRLYLQAIADSIQQHWQQHGQAELLLISFHGLPAKLTELGDPYFYHCQRTANMIAEKLALHDYQWQLVFQSRFGKAKWLQPYCVDILQSLPQQGIKNIEIICPGFAVDCLETLEEIAQTNKNIFIAAGGENYHYIKALNTDDAHVELLNNLIKQPADC